MKLFSALLVALICFALAAVIHNFYIDYEEGERLNDEFIFSWQSSPEVTAAVRADLLRQWADERARSAEAAKYRELSDAIEKDAYKQCNYKDLGKAFDCLSDKIHPGHSDRTALAKTTRQEVFSKSIRNLAGKAALVDVWSGMVPSRFITDGSSSTKARAKASATALWRGIFLPSALVLAGLWLVAYAVISRRKKTSGLKQDSHPASATYTPLPAEALPAKPVSALVQMLREKFGADFPVSEGDATRDNPLVITRKVDYVSVEYVVAEHVIRSLGEEYAKEQQGLHHLGGRAIDELVFRVKPSGAEDWTGIRRFFFDITTGFKELGK